MKKELWTRLRRYHFDNLVPPHLAHRVLSSFGGADASTRAFASKLARKAGWDNAFALRAIAEYRKFIYLGIVADFNVTPPKVIDQVWHEHLLFSRAYREFCRDVLQRDFDHNPELVPVSSETDVYQAQYCATLDLYEAEFHAKAPHDIWGGPKFGARSGRGDAVPRRARDDGPFTSDGGSGSSDDTPLYLLFGSDSGGWAEAGADFGGGGGFSGGGGGSSWGDGESSADQGGESGGDSGGGDSGGGDSGSSCGSGCSSSCGSSD